MSRFWSSALFVTLAACGGSDECEDGVILEVTVATVDGSPTPTVTVEVDETPCTPAGTGFECVVPEAGSYQVYVTPDPNDGPPFYEALGITVEVPELEEGAACDEPADSITATLTNEAGGA